MEQFEVLIQFIEPKLFILIPFIWSVGLFLKKAPSFPMDWMIPFILWVVSVCITVSYIAVVIGEGFTAVVILVGFIQGTLIAAVAVLCNEMIKQALIKRLADKKG